MEYSHDYSLFSIERIKLKERIFRRLARKSTNLFIRGSDLISVSPQIDGVWEPELTDFINSCASRGFGGFLIDIGANIGLTSCQTGLAFKRIHMIEPNPLCVHVLTVNAAIALRSGSYQIHSVGLGGREEKQVLMVPRNNWGGAFIRSSGNLYDDQLLSKKDGFSGFDPSNYIETEIELKDTSVIMRKLFADCLAQGLDSGVIKIDVEGFEEVVLKGIADSIPEDMRAIIVFENFIENLDFESIVTSFGTRGSGFVLERQPPWQNDWPRWFKAISLAWNSNFNTRLVDPANARSLIGELVIEVD